MQSASAGGSTESLVGWLPQDPGGLIVLAAVFTLTLLLVCGVGYLLLMRRTMSGGMENPHEANFQIQLSGKAPDLGLAGAVIPDVVSRLAAKPEMMPERQSLIEGLDRTRALLTRIYRVLITILGVAGVAAAIAVFSVATTANGLALVGCLILIFSLLALAKVWIPDGSGAWAAGGGKNFQINVQTPEALTYTLDEPAIQRAHAMLQSGRSVEEAALAVNPHYAGWSSFQQRAFQWALRESVKNVRREA